MAAVGMSGDPELEVARARAYERLFDTPSSRSYARYRVLECVGRGAMGAVFAAYDAELDRRVALKVVSLSGNTVDEKAQQRLLREAQALARVSHPNVVAVHDVGPISALAVGGVLLRSGHDDPVPTAGVFVAMEFVSGLSLRRWLAQRERSWRAIVEVMLQAGRGVTAAHEAGLIHRDIKPDNIMVGDDGRVRVMDFGLVREQERHSSDVSSLVEPRAAPRDVMGQLTDDGNAVGTPAYMAPEQFDGHPADAKSDAFSYAVTFWEALHGTRPYTASSLAALAAAMQAGPALPADASTPAWLRNVLARALMLDPARRWPTMAAFLQALEADPSRRRRRVLAALAGACVVTVALAGVQLDRARRRAECSDAAAAIAQVWNADERQRLVQAFGLLDKSHVSSTRDRLLPRLDAYAAGWREVAEQACLTAELEGRDHETRLRSDECLENARLELAGLVGRMANADLGLAIEATALAAQLPPPQECDDPTALALRPPPALSLPEHDAIAAARAVLIAPPPLGASERARRVAELERVVADADSIGFAPLRVEARDRLGRMLRGQAEYAAAASAFEDATTIAISEGLEPAALSTMARLVMTAGYDLAEDERALAWSRMALALADRIAPRGLITAEVVSCTAAVYLRKGEFRRARELLLEADAIYEEVASDHPDRSGVWSNLGVAEYWLDDLHGASEAFMRATALAERGFGADHPKVAVMLANGAQPKAGLGHHAEALADLGRALAIEEKVTGRDSPQSASTIATMALIEHDLGHDDRALELAERSLAIREREPGPNTVDAATSRFQIGVILLAQGRYAGARAQFVLAESIRRDQLGLDDLQTIAAALHAATVSFAIGDLADATRRVDAARTILAANPNASALDRGVADLLFAALRRLAGDIEGSRTALEQALARYEAVDEAYYQAAVRLELAATALADDDPQRALDEARQALDGFESWYRRLPIDTQGPRPGAEDIGRTQLVLARAYLGLGDLRAAEAASRAASAAATEMRGPDHPSVADALLLRAQLQLAIGDPEAALLDAERALEIRESVQLTGPWRAEARWLAATIRAGMPGRRSAALREVAQICRDADHARGTLLDGCTTQRRDRPIRRVVRDTPPHR